MTSSPDAPAGPDWEPGPEAAEVSPDSELMAGMREGLDDLAAGPVHDQDDIERAMREAGRL